jgi:replicative DNA helicase
MTDLTPSGSAAGLLGTHAGPDAPTRAGIRAARSTSASRLPYGFDALQRALDSGSRIWIAGDRYDVDALSGAGVAACCSAGEGGLSGWADFDSELVVGARSVVVVAGAGATVQAWAVVGSLYRAGVTANAVTVLETPAGSVAEHLAGAGLDELRASDPPADIDLTPPRPEPTPALPDLWPDPEPLELAGAARPSFPVDVLPPWLRRQVVAVADHYQVPIDLPAMLAVGALMVATLAKVRVARPGGWMEWCNLYLVTALGPSAGKSVTYRAMMGCIDQLEAELIQDARTRIADAERHRRILQGRVDAAYEAAQQLGAAPDAHKLVADLETELDALDVPHVPRLVVDDCTMEKLTILLGEHGDRMALISSETDLFQMMAGRYSGGSNFGVILRGLSGDRFNQDRVKRASVDIREPKLGICITTQPVVLAGAAANPEFRGRGLLERFMFAVPQPNVGFRDRSAHRRKIPREVTEQYRQRIVGLGRAHHGLASPTTHRLSAEADQLYERWDYGLELRLRPGHDLAEISEWAGRLRSMVLRLACLLHVADVGPASSTEIPEETLARALRVGDYWIAHYLAANDLWAARPDVVGGKARRILEWAIANDITSFTARDLTLRLRRQFLVQADALEPLQLGAECGWWRAERPDWATDLGRRSSPSPRFIVRPDAAAWLNKADAQVAGLVAG